VLKGTGGGSESHLALLWGYPVRNSFPLIKMPPLLCQPRLFNRYYAIVRPLEYPLNMTHKTVCFMLANVWILPALISFTPIFLGWYTTEEHLREVSLHPDQCSFVVNKAYALISSSVSFWIPGIVMLVMYWRIFK